MQSLEKKMFFLPNRLFLQQNTLYVSFDLTAIPRDMKVTSMTLHLPLHQHTHPYTVVIKEILESWSVKKIKRGMSPCIKEPGQRLQDVSSKRELRINVIRFHKKWRMLRSKNHGVCAQLINKGLSYNVSTPPYLIVETL